MVFLDACLRGLRDRPGSGVRPALIAAFVGLVASRLWLRMDVAWVCLVTVLAAGIGALLPSAIHEAHGRWQLRPRCWEQDGGWHLGITPRWREPFTGTCVVTDGFGRSTSYAFSQPGGSPAEARFPSGSTPVQSADGDRGQPPMRYLVRWTVRQAGNDFEANTAFVWR